MEIDKKKARETEGHRETGRQRDRQRERGVRGVEGYKSHVFHCQTT